MAQAWLALVVELYVPPGCGGDEVTRAAQDWLRPFVRLVDRHRGASLTVALDPGLSLELLRHGQAGVLQGLAAMVERGQVELAAGSRNHALLPRLPREEIERQIRVGDEVMREALGRSWRPQGLFPPALAWARQVAEAAAARGLRWVLADELALGRVGEAPNRQVAALRGRPDVLLYFRDRQLSAALGRGDDPGGWDGYKVAVVDASAFRSGSAAAKRLESLLGGRGPKLATPTQLASTFGDRILVEPLPCSWRTTPEELAAGIAFAPWSAPDNEAQALLWRLAGLGMRQVRAFEALRGEAAYTRMRALVDEGLHSAPFRLASGKDGWNPDEVLAAARRLVLALEQGESFVGSEEVDRARRLESRLREALGERPVSITGEAAESGLPG